MASRKIMHKVKINLFLCHTIIIMENILFAFASTRPTKKLTKCFVNVSLAT